MSDVLIGQAENVLRRRFGIGATDAFSLLVRLACQQNRSLVSVAGELVEQHQQLLAQRQSEPGRKQATPL